MNSSTAARVARPKARRATQGARMLAWLLVFVLVAVLIRLPQASGFDLAATRFLQALRTPVLDEAVVGITVLGGTGSLLALSIVAALVLWREGLRRAAALAAISSASVLLNVGLKDIFERPRPGVDLVEVIAPVLGTSFPSGHAMGATTVFGFFAYLAWSLVPGKRERLAFVLLFSFLALAVGLSRVYLGAHWLSDVVGGFAAGLLLLEVLAILYALALKKRADAEEGFDGVPAA